MKEYEAWVEATLIGKPKEIRTGKMADPVQFVNLESRLEQDILPPEALDTTDFFAVEPVTVAELWIEKICKVKFLIRDIEATDISDAEETIRQILKVNKNSAKVKDIEILEIKRQNDQQVEDP